MDVGEGKSPASRNPLEREFEVPAWFNLRRTLAALQEIIEVRHEIGGLFARAVVALCLILIAAFVFSSLKTLFLVVAGLLFVALLVFFPVRLLLIAARSQGGWVRRGSKFTARYFRGGIIVDYPGQTRAKFEYRFIERPHLRGRFVCFDLTDTSQRAILPAELLPDAGVSWLTNRLAVAD